MKFYVTGTRRGLGKYLYERLNTVESLEECDIFINCKHDGFEQVHMLYEAASLGKKVSEMLKNMQIEGQSNNIQSKLIEIYDDNIHKKLINNLTNLTT